MKVTRREFLRFGLGGAATMVTAAAAPLLQSTEAYAIAGVDDAVIGGLVLVMMTLAGYYVSDALTSTSMADMGYDFSRFASDVNNQSAAAARAIADANNLGVQVNRQNAEDAAAAIAAGTGAAGQWLSDMADSGRIAIDGWLSGIGANQAALWGLVGEYVSTALGALPTPSADATIGGASYSSIHTSGVSAVVQALGDVVSLFPYAVSGEYSWAIYAHNYNGTSNDVLWIGDDPSAIVVAVMGNELWFKAAPGKSYRFLVGRADGSGSATEYIRSGSTIDFVTNRDLVFGGDVVIGPVLPGVDRAADAPETYGAGYDKTILGKDMVIDPVTGDVVSAGSIALPVDYPYVQLPYVDGLYQQGAGVVPGLQDLPISGDTGVVVGTEQGVATMPISQAVTAETSLAEVSTPVDPVVPPGTPDVGPWTPAYDLPFYDVWPFNMIYSFVSALSELGGE